MDRKRATMKAIRQELEAVGGTLEWVTDYGIGIRFSSLEPDGVLARIPLCLQSAAWINLANTEIGDLELSQLEGAPLIESLHLNCTQITAKGLERFVSRTPSIREVSLSPDQFRLDELDRFRRRWPRVHIVTEN